MPTRPALCLCTLIIVCLLALSITASAAGAAGKNGHAGLARTILGLTQEKKADGFVITITGDGVMKKYIAYGLQGPPRLVIDFPGISFPDGPDAYRGPDDVVKKIRIGRLDADKTRIVFDFQGRTTTPFHIVEDGSALHVEFVTAKEENSTPRVSIVNPTGSINVNLGDTVSFDARVTGGNAPVLREWSVSGNGITKTLPELDSLAFDQPGSFTITCRVTDRDGELANDSVRIFVAAPPTPHRAQASSRTTGRVSLFFGDGIYHTGSVGDFSIQETVPGSHTTWSLTRKDNCMITAGASCRLTDLLALDLGLSGNVGDSDTTLILMYAGPRLLLTGDYGWGAYLRAGPTYGHFDWSSAPGDFDSAVGWELGGGATMPLGSWKLGLDLTCRGISFGYNTPDMPGVTANKDEIDFSGVSIYFVVQHAL